MHGMTRRILQLQGRGYKKCVQCRGADITKIKAGRREQNNHYFNNNDNAEVNPQMVMSQISRYNDPADMEGHLYGAIIASLREYKRHHKAANTLNTMQLFALIMSATCPSRCITLLMMISTRKHHGTNDGIVEDEVLKNISLIEKKYVSHYFKGRIILKKALQEKSAVSPMSQECSALN